MHDINWIDYSIMGVLGISVFMGLIRGFVREAMSLVTWIVAIVIAVLYYEPVASWFTRISIPGVRALLAAILLVLVTLIAGGIIGHLMGGIIKLTGFGMTDRMVGTIFGFARGVAIVAVVVLIGNVSFLAKEQMWKQSEWVPKFEPVAQWIQEKLPSDFVKRLEFLKSEHVSTPAPLQDVEPESIS